MYLRNSSLHNTRQKLIAANLRERKLLEAYRAWKMAEDGGDMELTARCWGEYSRLVEKDMERAT